MPSRVIHVLLGTIGAVLLVLLTTTFLKLGQEAIAGAAPLSPASTSSVPVAARSTPVPGDPIADTPVLTPSPTTTPTDMPTVEPTDWIDTAVYVTPTNTSVLGGQSITITPQLIVTGTCEFPIYDITLKQDPMLFAYSDPLTDVVRGGSASWRLTAFRAGVTTFTAVYYGETHCNNVWQWNYAEGQSQPVTVTGDIFGMPFIGKAP